MAAAIVPGVRPLAAPILLLTLILAALVIPPATAASLDAVRRLELSRLERLRGPALDPAALRGEAVLVSFFASWCPPCEREFRVLKKLDAAFRGRGLRIVAVNLFEGWGGRSDEGRLRAFLDRHDPPFTVLRGEGRSARLFGGVERIPTLWLFAPGGRARLHFVHAQGAAKAYLTLAELEAAVEAALSGSAAHDSPEAPAE